jgi:hypothetical protein
VYPNKTVTSGQEIQDKNIPFLKFQITYYSMTDYNSFRTEFLTVFHKISHLTKDDILFGPMEEYEPALESLRKFGQRKVDNSLVERSQANPDVVRSLKKVTEIMYYSNLRRELEDAKRIINSPDPWQVLENLPYYEPYKSTVCMEHREGGPFSNNRIFFLGSGPLPLSLILFCRLFGVESIGIEREKEFYDISLNVLHKLKLTDKITIIHGDHFSIPFELQFDHLFVALDAEPKIDILKELENHLPTGAKFSIRVNPATNVIANDTKNNYLASAAFRVTSQADAVLPGLNSVIFFIKT